MANNLSDDLPVRAIDGLWRYYEEHTTHARQHELLRAQATSILSAIAAGVAALAGIGGLTPVDVPAGIMVVLVSLIGIAVNQKHYERNRLHSSIAGAVRDEISGVLPSGKLREPGQVRSSAESKHNCRWPTVHRVRLHLLWALVPAQLRSWAS